MVSRAISLHNRGNVRVCVHDYDGAIKDYGEYIEFEENAGEYGGTPFYNRGNTFALTKQWDRAISDYMKAIDRNECSHDSHYNLANIFVIVEQYDAALVHYDEAVRVKPDFENALRNRSTTRALAGQLEEAMQGFTEYGSVGNNCALVSSALNGTKVSGNLTLIGNTGNTGNISLAALRGPGGGKGFSGSKAFAKRFVWSGTEGVCGQE